MKERGILFNGEMVRAVLDDRKANTRRIVTPQPHSYHDNSLVWAKRLPQGKRHWTPVFWQDGKLLDLGLSLCPYGRPGDRLWVREAWRVGSGYDELPGSKFTSPSIYYEADGDKKGAGFELGRYRHARFMPRWASRITLEITDVRAERLNDISEEDAIAEGVEPNCGLLDHTNCKDHFGEWLMYPLEKYEGGEPAYSAKESFSTLWESINGEGSWDANPWVWVVEFKRLDT